jgi:hypothetical protein
MGTEHIVSLLIQERDRLTRAIEALQGPATKRIGRPPKNPLAVVAMPAMAAPAQAPAARKRAFSATHRKMLSKKLKAYWAKRKAEEGKAEEGTK